MANLRRNIRNWHKRLALGILIAMVGSTAYAADIKATVIKPEDSTYNNTVATKGNVTNVINQRMFTKNVALNTFSQFDVAKDTVANMQLGDATSQVNVIRGDMNVNGMLNTIKDGKIGGNSLFIASGGIAIGSSGIINAGNLGLVAGQPLQFESSGLINQNVGKYVLGAKGNVVIDGTINTTGGLAIAAQNITIGSTGIINGRVNFTNAIDTTNWNAGDYTTKLVNTAGTSSAMTVTPQADGTVTLDDGSIMRNDVVLKADSAITLDGTVLTNGGDFIAEVASDSGDTIKIEGNTGKISTRSVTGATSFDSNSTGTSSGDSGDITIHAKYDGQGQSEVKLGAMHIVNSADATYHGGSTFIGAETTTNLINWVNLDSEVKADVALSGTTVTAGRLQVAAYANNNFSPQDTTKTVVDDQGNVVSGVGKFGLDSKIFSKGSGIGSDIYNYFVNNLADSRILAVWSNVSAAANVTIDKDAKLTTTGNKPQDKAGQDLTRDVLLTASAGSGIIANNYSSVAALAVGISKADAAVNVTDKSVVTAADDLTMKSQGLNSITLTNTDNNYDGYRIPANIAVSYAALGGTIDTAVSADSSLSAGGNIDVKSALTRVLSSSVANAATLNCLGASVGIVLSDTTAKSTVLGTTTANGTVTVSADNTPSYNSATKAYGALTNSVTTAMGGAGFMNPVKKWITEQGGKAWNFLEGLGYIGLKDKDHVIKSCSTTAGFGVAFAYSQLSDTAAANLGGNVNAGNVSVQATTVERPKTLTNSTIGDIPKTDAQGKAVPDATRKVAGAVALGLDFITSTATAKILDGANVTLNNTGNGEVNVGAEIKVPYESLLQTFDHSSVITGIESFASTVWSALSSNLNMDNFFFDNWACSSASGDAFSGAVSFEWTKYTNNASASIGAGVTLNNVNNTNVTSDVEIETFNMSGVAKPITEIIKNWVASKNKSILGSAAANGVGGSVLKTEYDNTVLATIGMSNSDAKSTKQTNISSARRTDSQGNVSGGNVKVSATTTNKDIVIAASGGSAAGGVAFDGDVSLDWINDTTKADIYNTNIHTDGDVTVKATDTSDLETYGVAGSYGTGSGVGASVAWNNVTRDTEAHFSGLINGKKNDKVTDAGNVQVLAKNDGLILAVSLAGSVSTRAGADQQVANEDVVHDVAGEGANGMIGNGDWAVGVGDVQDAIAGVAAAKRLSKNTWAAAGSVGYNHDDDTAKATIDNNYDTNQTSGIRAKSVDVAADNDSLIVAPALNGALNFNSGGAIAGDFHFNSVKTTTAAAVSSTALDLSGSRKEKDTDTKEGLRIHAANADKIVNVTASAAASTYAFGNSSGASAFSLAGQIGLNYIDDTTTAIATKNKVYADYNSLIEASDDSKIYGIGGAVAYSSSSAGVGASWITDDIKSVTTAQTESTDFDGDSYETGTTRQRGGDVTVHALNTSRAATYAVGCNVATGAKGFAAGGSVAVTRLDAQTKASLSGDKSSVHAGNVNVYADDASLLTTVSGELNASKQAAVGVAVAWTKDKADTSATVGNSMAIDADSVSVKVESALDKGSKDVTKSDTSRTLDSSDMDVLSMGKTVAIGGSLSRSLFSGTGSLVYNDINRTATADIGSDDKLNISGNVLVEANNTTRLFGLAGAVVVSTQSVGLGAAVTYENLDTQTKAFIGQNTNIATAKDITVSAKSDENLINAAAGLAASKGFFGAGAAVNALYVKTTTTADLENGVKLGADDKNRVGNVTVTAADTAASDVFDVSVAITGGTLGLGAALDWNYLDRNITASLGEKDVIFANSLSLDAMETSTHWTLPLGVAASGSFALEGSGTVNAITQNVNAGVGSDTTIDAQGDKGFVHINADNAYTFTSYIAAMQFSLKAAGGAGYTYNSYTGTTNAYTGNTDTITAQNLFDISAASSETVTETAAEVGISKYAVIGANIINNNMTTATKAYTGTSNTINILKGTKQKDNDQVTDSLIIKASDKTTGKFWDGGLGATFNLQPWGFSGTGGLAWISNTFDKTTQAYIGASSTLNAAYNQTISALNDENISSTALQGNAAISALGIAGAGSYISNVINTNTQAYVAEGVKINQSNYMGMDSNTGLFIDALHHQVFNAGAYSVALGTLAAVSGVINYGTFYDTTEAYIGASSQVMETGDVSVTSTNNGENIKGTFISGSGGVIGSFNYNDLEYDFGTTDAAAAKKDTQELPGWEKALESIKGSQSTVYDKFIQHSEQTTLDKAKLTKTTTSAFMGNNASVKAGSIEVKAADTLQLDTVGGGGGLGVASVGVTGTTIRNARNVYAYTEKTGDLTTTSGNIQVAANRNDKDTFSEFGASLGALVVPYSSYTLYDTGSSVAYLQGSAIQAADGIDVTANSAYDISGTNTGAAVGGVSVVYTTNNIYLNEGLIDAHIGADTALQAGVTGNAQGWTRNKKSGNIKVTADTKAKVDVTAKAPFVEAGLYAGAITKNTTSDTLRTTAYIGSASAINNAGSVTISATSTPQLSSKTTSLALGTIGVGTLGNTITEKETVLANLQQGVAVKNAAALDVTARMAMPENKVNSVYTLADGYALGLVAGDAGITTTMTMDNLVDTNIAKKVSVTVGKISLTADNENRFNFLARAAGRGILGAGGGVDATVTVKNTTGVDIANAAGADEGASLTGTDGGIVIKADSVTERNWLTDKDGMLEANQNIFVSGKAMLGAGGGISNDVSITHDDTVNVGAYAVLTGIASVTDPAAYYNNNAVTIDAGSTINSKEYLALYTGSIGAGAGLNSNGTHNNRYTVTSAVNLAANSIVRSGYADRVISSEKTDQENKVLLLTDTDLSDTNYRFSAANNGGGNIAIGVSNKADIFSAAYGNVTALIGWPTVTNDNGYAGTATINANGTVETTVGDIFLRAGEASDGTVPTIKLDSLAYGIAHAPFQSGDEKVAATVSNHAGLNVGATGELFSDRDIYLTSDYGTIKAKGIGEEREVTDKTSASIVNNVGINKVDSAAAVAVNGKVATGIHRNKVMAIGGGMTTDGVDWNTKVTRNSSIGYTFIRGVTANTELINRWKELQKLKAQYASDAAAYAGYDAESRFIESKLVNNGQGAYDKNQNFILIESSTISDYDKLTKGLASLKASDSGSSTVSALRNALTELEGAKLLYDQAIKTISECQKALEQAKTGSDKTAITKAENNLAAANTKKTTAEGVLNSDLTAYNALVDTDSQISVVTTETLATAEKLVQTQQSSVTEYTDALNKMTVMQKVSDLFYNQGGTTTLDADQDYVYTLNGQAIASDAALQKALASHLGTTGLETKDLIMDNLVSNYKQADKATGQIILDDVTATLGNIYVQGSSLTGSGALKAAGDAGISVIDSAPDSIKLGNMTITDGGRIYFNNNEIKTNSDMNKLNAAKDGGTANFQTIVNRDTSNAPVINVESNFQASTAEYQKVVYNSDHTSYFTYNLFAAPSITVATGKTLLNAYGSVRLHSNEGDIHNNGAINAGSIDINANDGDFIQSYSSGTYHVGGDPEAIYDNGKWDGTVGGITANGNIYVNAQYLNINGKIQSGIADWTLDLPADVNSLKVTYKQNGTTVTKTIGSLTDEEKAYTLHLSTDYGNMAPYVVYDSANKKLVVDNVNIHGGNVTLVGTIMNTGSGINKANGTVTGGSVIALDGYGQINLTNQSGLPLEIRNVSADTAENGVKGSIIISDIDRSGSTAKVTTYKYTRENGVQKVYLKQSDGSWQDVTSTTSATSFAPQANLVYTKMAGTTTNTVRSYYESKFKLFDWVTVHSGDPEALLISTSTGENLSLSKAGYVQAGYLNKPTEAYFLTHDATPFLSPSDTTVKKDAAGNITTGTTPYYVWMAYQINANTQTNRILSTTDYLILTKYQYTWNETTSTNNYDAKTFRADNPIAIGYVGSGTPGNISIASNSSINLAGTLSNKAGNVILSAKDGNNIQSIKPTEVINANSLTFDTTGAIGSADLSIQTRTNSLASLQKSANLYVKNISTADMALGSDIAVNGVATLTSGGSITDAAGHTISAQRLNIRSEGGDLGTAAAPIKFVSGAPEGGKNVDYGISASAQSDVYLSTSGEALVDHIDSNEGNVWLYAKQGIYDNNTNESTNESVADKLLNWKNLGVLEGTEELLSRQKEILKNEVVNEYKAYLYYKGVLANEKALSTTEQADYDYLIAKGLDKWTKAGVEAYTPTVTKTASGINYVYSYADDGFLTASEQKDLLTGTAVTETELLLTLAPGLEAGVTDTNPVIKAYANIKGNDITLLTGTSVGDRSDKLNFTVDLTKSLKTYAESAEGSSHLLALATAEKGDATTSTDGSTFTASVYKVSPVEVDAKGTVTTKFVDDGGSEVTPAAKNDVYLVAETTDPTVVGNISGDRVRIKTVGDLTSAANTAVSANQADLILESAEGRVNVNIGKTVGITSRSGSDIVLNGTGTDIPVDMIYAANSVTINSGAADILGLEGDKGVNIRANNVQLNGNHVGTGTNTLGLTLTDTATASNITAQNGIDLYLAQMAVNFGSLDSTAGDIVIHSDDDIDLQAGSIHTAGNLMVSAGSLDVGTVEANTATLVSRTDLTATGAIHTTGDSTLQAATAIKVTEVTSDTGNINAVAGDDLTGNTLTALNGDIHLEAGSINVGTINAGNNVTGTATKGAVTTGSVTSGTASLTAKTYLMANGAIHTADEISLQAGNNMVLTDVTSDEGNINAVAGDDLTGNTLTALNGDIHLEAGSINVGTINAGNLVTGSSTQGDLSVDRLTADAFKLEAIGDMNFQDVSATNDVMLKTGNNLNLGSVTSTNGSFNGSAGKSLLADTVSAVNGKVIANGQVIDINHLYSGDISGYGEAIDLPHVSYSGDGPIRIQLQGEDGSTAQSVKVNVDESLRGVIYDHLNVEDGSLYNNTDMATLNDAFISGDFLLTNAYIRYGRTGPMPNSSVGKYINWLALIGRGTSFADSTYIYRNSNGLPMNNQYFYDTVESTAMKNEKHVRDWWATMRYDEAGKQQPFMTMAGRAQLFIDNPVVQLRHDDKTDDSDMYLWHW